MSNSNRDEILSKPKDDWTKRKMKVMSVFGTRPEAIKMAPVLKLIETIPNMQNVVCLTGQHVEMIQPALELFNIIPDFECDLQDEADTMANRVGEMVKFIGDRIADVQPDIVLVHGDTISTVAGALAAFYNNKKVGHVEAGLRSFDLTAPWPEEGNRKVVSTISDFNFAPSTLAKQNLISEGVPSQKIHITGNTVVDALLSISNEIDNQKLDLERLQTKFRYLNPNSKLVLATCHRRENFGPKTKQIFGAFQAIANSNSSVQIVLPAHLNPAIFEQAITFFSETKNVFVVPPQDYLSFVYLLKLSYMVVTDSGGIQEEAPILSKPVLVLRDKTERPEATDSNAVKLIGSSKKTIVNEMQTLLDSPSLYSSMAKFSSPYGDGSAAKKIVETIQTYVDA